uniref:Uncharacterized protein n=1 Tax=Coccolithus braarudii TaxID=221442 RepID=A0A6T7FYM7_9EUKA|mmetsp:Transcript_30667/g.65879  ORF Transcript_30667/g.65879 Transcript_30667/m.65879 type:complete len:114 (+) Transcript_30667:51-392(+)|eukprot:CAMPEP_0183336756 /NCGR_PEP_ID=MMETSP0164_2-20130417/4633_1 /TAXON_ID=221442 /ORGANISM="Coccolithus pelagicus ssp braarudi, Strain PLY182g" /LENGTH=113 /DNA_ID=CAMNT_0025506341 /DNA_START=25 /DNA_END=366 /DNA_ORIENTATION=+
MVRRELVLVLVLVARCATALRVAPQFHAPSVTPSTSRCAAPLATLVEPTPILDAADMLAASPPLASMLPMVLTSDIIDALAGFANSPAILLIPIGAGTVVASLIILILVKSAG